MFKLLLKNLDSLFCSSSEVCKLTNLITKCGVLEFIYLENYSLNLLYGKIEILKCLY